jgi:transcriptional regulator with XRE-family HTH domain
MATTEFGQTVHRWRDRVSPETVGLPAGGHRRAAGLRREELALLAGISVDYITRLEQGRASNPSAQVVEALARALRLSGPERAHLFRLAGLAPPGPETVPAYITPSVQRLLDRLTGTPVAVYDASWTLLVANPPYAALMGDPSGWRGNQRNSVWRHFLGREPEPGTPRSPCARSRQRWSPTYARPPAATRPTNSYSGWSRNCARTATGSPSCGTAAPSATTRPPARPSIIRR